MPRGPEARAAPPRGGTQAGGVERGIGCRDRVGDESLIADDDGAPGNGGESGQLGLDLAEFDPVSAELDLPVGTAEVVDRAVGAAAHQVAGAVHAGAGFGRVGVGDEAVGGERGASVVAAGQLDAGEVQLAGDTVRHRAQARIEHAQAGVPHGSADGHGGAGLAVVGVVRHVDGGLGGAVEVVQRDAGQLVPAVRGRPGQCLAAAEHAAQAARPRGVGGDLVGGEERLQHRGHEVHRRDALGPDQAGQTGGVAVPVGAARTTAAPSRSAQKNSQTLTSKLDGVFCNTRSSGVSS